MKLGRVLKILKFEQSDWLKKYINFNTDKKKKMLPIVLKKWILSGWIISFMAKQ